MAEEQHDGQPATRLDDSGECRDASNGRAASAASSSAALKTSSGHDSPLKDEHVDKENSNDVDHPSATAGTTSKPQQGTELMGLPGAPASMFWTFEPGARAKDATDRIDDPYIACRLVAVVLILFRAGDIKYDKTIGRFTVDLVGKKKWCDSLPAYLSSKPDRGDY